MSIKKIYILFCLLVIPGLMFQPYLRGMGDINPDMKNRKQYESYLVIKYLIHLNQFEKAEAAINQYLENYPHDPFILAEKASLLVEEKGKTEEALQLLKKSKAIYPGYYFSNYIRALILFNQTETVSGLDPDSATKEKHKEKHEEAVKCLEIAIKDNPGFYDAYYLLGIILNARGEYKKSNQYFEKANRLNQTASTYLYMVSNYKNLGEPDGVIKAYQSILAVNSSHYQALAGLSEIYLEKKDYNTASVYLEQLYRQYPDDKDIAAEYLYSLIAGGEIDKFMKTVDNVEISDIPDLLYTKALLLTQQEKYDEAEQTLKKVKSTDLKARLLQAEIHLHQHNYYQAYQILELVKAEEKDYLYYSVKLHTLSLLDMNQRIAGLFTQLQKDTAILEKLTADDFYTFIFAFANLYDLEKVKEVARTAKNYLKDKSELFMELVDALQSFSPGKVIDIETLQFDLNHFLIATFYKKQQQYKQAIFIINKMIQKQSDKQNAYLELCDIYQEQKQPRKVEHLLLKLLKQFPSSLQVKNYYAYFLALENKKLEHALELSAYTLREDKENPAYNDTYGYILLRLGRLSEAGKYLEKAYHKHPFELEIIGHLADYYRSHYNQEKHQQQIFDMYKTAIDNDVDFKDHLIEEIKKLENAKKNRP
jgi:tetratricopeptide (TPR) repeat protein